MIPFGAYEPDQPVTVGGVTHKAVGVIPIADNESGVAYGPYPQLSTPSSATALAEDPRGTISIVDSAGVNHVFIGQSTSIIEMDATWGPVTIDSGLSLTPDDDWSFAQFGSFLIATNTTNGMWAYNIDTASGAGNIAGAPKARHVFKTNEVLIALDCDGNNRRWQNCAMGDHTNWSTLEANYDDLEGGGALLVGFDISNGRAIWAQEGALRIVNFGGSALFKVTKVGTDVGSVGARSMVAFNGLVFGLHTKGFFVTNGADIRWIGDNKVDRTFLASIDTVDMALVQVSVDPFNKLVMWYYNGSVLVYSWTLDKWSTLDISINALIRVGTPGYNSDTADALGNVDTVGMPGPDSRFWQGGAVSLGAFGTDYKISFFTGGNQAAEIDTAVKNFDAAILIQSATPLTDDSAATLSCGAVDLIGDTIGFGADVGRQSSGRVPLRKRGKNVVFRQKHAANANWSFARGISHVESGGGGVR